MSALLRLAVILGGIALLFVLLAANKHVVQKYWLPAVEDVEHEDVKHEDVEHEDGGSTDEGVRPTDDASERTRK